MIYFSSIVGTIVGAVLGAILGIGFALLIIRFVKSRNNPVGFVLLLPNGDYFAGFANLGHDGWRNKPIWCTAGNKKDAEVMSWWVAQDYSTILNEVCLSNGKVFIVKA